MRSFWLCLVSLCLTVVLAVPLDGAAAQDAPRRVVTAACGMSLTLPADWFVTALEGLDSFSAIDPNGVGTYSITLPPDIETVWGASPETLDDLLARMMEFPGADEAALGGLDYQLRTTGSVLVQPYETAGVAGAMIATQFYVGTYGTIVIEIADSGFEQLDTLIVEALRILDSVVVPVREVRLNPERMQADMPPGTIVFSTGAAITVPAGWRVKDERKPIGLIVTLIRADGSVRLTVELPEDPALPVDHYRREVAPALAESAGDTSFDPAIHFNLMTLMPDRPLLTYDSSLHRPKGSDAPVLWYQLLASEYGVVQITTQAADLDRLTTAYGDVLSVIGSYDTRNVLIDSPGPTCGLPSS